MELIRILNSQAFVQWMAQSLAVVFLVGGFVTLGVGLGLFFNSGGTLRLFESMNRWVSLRRATRPLELPRDTRSAVIRNRKVLAAVCILGGAFALYGLASWFDARSVIYVFGLDYFKPSFASWVADSARWVLVVGNVVAIAIGIALAFFPGAVETLEARGSRWYSERQLRKGSDALRLPLDQKVATYPRFSGLLMMFFGLVLVGTFGFMLAGMR